MSGISSGKLRHKVQLQEQVIDQDPVTGEMVTTWQTVAEPWAEVVPMSGREFLAAGAEQSEVRGRIVIRYRDDVDASMRVVYRGKYYNIFAVLPDAESGKEHLTLMTGEGVRSAPDAPLALTGDLPDGTVDEPYSATLTASGGRQPYSLGDVLLPPGLGATLSDSTVTVAGTPTEAWEGEAHIDLSDSLGTAIRRVFDVEVGVAPAPNALSPAKQAIEAGAGDVNLLVLGDSTGDATTEWVYLFAEWLATEYATHSVSYRPYSTGSTAYAEETVVSTGSGSNTIRIWNGSVSLTVPQSLMGQHFAAAIASVPSPDLVIWNYGHNILSTFYDGIIQGEVIGPMEMVRLYNPTIPHAYVLQNPRRDDDTQATKIAAIRSVSERRGDVTLINFYDRWIAAGKPAGWYEDNIHPSETGSQQNRDYFAEAWSATLGGAYPSLPPWLDTTATNLLTNGDFSNWPDTVPANWTVNGDAVIEQDTGIVDGGAAYSLRITGPTATATDIRQSLSSGARNALAGKRITLAVRLRASDSGATTGAIRLQVNSTFFQVNSGELLSQNGWRWVVIADVPVPETVTAIAVRLLPANTAIAGAYTNFDRVILVEGSNPRDMA